MNRNARLNVEYVLANFLFQLRVCFNHAGKVINEEHGRNLGTRVNQFEGVLGGLARVLGLTSFVKRGLVPEVERNTVALTRGQRCDLSLEALVVDSDGEFVLSNVRPSSVIDSALDDKVEELTVQELVL